MCTGVHSTVVLDRAPSAETLRKFEEIDERKLTVTLLADGRAHVSCFSPVEPTHSELAFQLRNSSEKLKSDMALLRFL